MRTESGDRVILGISVGGGNFSEGFLDNFTSRDTALAALAGNPEAFTQLANRGGTIVNCFFDLAVSNTFAQADVHNGGSQGC